MGNLEKAVQFAEKGATCTVPTAASKASLGVWTQANFNYALTLGQSGNEAEANRYPFRAKELAEKLLVLDPEDATAKDILNRITSGE